MDVLAWACAWLCQPPERAQAARFRIPNSFEAALGPGEGQEAHQAVPTPLPPSLNTSMMLQAKIPPFLSLKDALMLRASCKSFSKTTVFQLLLNYCSKIDVRRACESHRSAEQLVLSRQPMTLPSERGRMTLAGKTIYKSRKQNTTFSCCCGTCCPSERDQYRGSGCLDPKPRYAYLEPLCWVICRPVIIMAGETGDNMLKAPPAHQDSYERQRHWNGLQSFLWGIGNLERCCWGTGHLHENIDSGWRCPPVDEHEILF
ncbi:ded1 [Symbiodinium necroappetens]|uniref:Ded1 protein n=1 Tax=Symbiodinium necroappetens TaxID=1628268 RepID=A0A813CG37_9DINO|nr:ded1 [Symbiodinium necroappetens]